jgi:hypothetical protein
MSLFVVQHQHSPETCPARDPQMGAMLLAHVSQDNAEKYGIDIHGEGVVDGTHTFYLILEAQDGARVNEFMAPFAQAGTVDVLPASACEAVVGRAGC